MSFLENLLKTYPVLTSFSLGLMVSVVLGHLFVGRISKYSVKGKAESLKCPPGVDMEQLNKLVKKFKASPKKNECILKFWKWELWKLDQLDLIGILECSLFFIALWYEQPILIGGLMTFKVAAKWAAWKNIIKVPELNYEINIDNFDYLIFKKDWASLLLTHFLVGTFSNLFFAFIGYGVYLLLVHP